MKYYGIGVEGVASEIGALGRENLKVKYSQLLEGLCYRFDTTTEDAEFAIRRALEVGAVINKEGYICLVLDD